MGDQSLKDELSWDTLGQMVTFFSIGLDIIRSEASTIAILSPRGE